MLFPVVEKGNLRCSRHNLVVYALVDLANLARLTPDRSGKFQYLRICSETGDVEAIRPGDLVVDGDNSNNYRRICIDVTIGSPLSEAKADSSEGTIPGKLAVKAASDKIEKNRVPCELVGKEFVAFSVDVCGTIDVDGFELLSRMASAYAYNSSSPITYALSIFRRRISFAIQLGVARQLLRAVV